HGAVGGAHECDERFRRNGVRREFWSGEAALADKAVALPAAVLDEGGLALFRRRGERAVTDQQGGGKQRRRPHARTQTRHGAPHRGWVHTSTSAGWPDFTAATARLIVGPTSLGSLIGPADHQPIEFASLA